MDTLELKIDLTPTEPWSDIVIAELSEKGFDSFVNTETGIIAYGPVTIDVKDVIAKTSLSADLEFEYALTSSVIPKQNWNSAWEENFQPVYIEDYATILAPFHDKSNGTGLVVELQPQMSFGTGHHQTTWMMTKALFELDGMSNNVLDMGTGTGVLAIVAEKLGAKKILAIDIEDWSAANAAENADRNGCKNIECVRGDIDRVGDEKFGLIIANINKNILKVQLPTYAKAINQNGTLLLSGFFGADVDEMVEEAHQYGFEKTKVFSKDEWAAVQLQKKN